MSNERNDRRLQAITSLMHQLGHNSSDDPIQPRQLEDYKAALLQLSGHVDLFSEEDFPTPTSKEIAKTYLRAENPDAGAALYLVSILPFGPSQVHDHGTFAIIAGLSGFEHNTV